MNSTQFLLISVGLTNTMHAEDSTLVKTKFAPSSTEKSPPAILGPAHDALVETHRSFRHILNLTRRRKSDSTNNSDKPQRPSMHDIRELTLGLEKFGQFLHATQFFSRDADKSASDDDANAIHQKAMDTQQQACEKMQQAYALYDGLMATHEKCPPLTNFNAYEKPQEKRSVITKYRLCKMLTQQKDTRSGHDRFHSQPEWEEIFRSHDRTADLSHANEASWRVAIEDAVQAANESFSLFRHASKLLRDTAKTEALGRRDEISKISNEFVELYNRYINLSDTFNRIHLPTEYKAGVNIKILIGDSLPYMLRNMDMALQTLAEDELKTRGRKVETEATTFDCKLIKITTQINALRKHIVFGEEELEITPRINLEAELPWAVAEA